MFAHRELGNTGIKISPIGISTSFGAKMDVYEEAFEAGCNYFTWGTFIKGRSTPFRKFIRKINAAGKREQLFIGLLSYSHTTILGNRFLHSALKQLETDYLDTLLLGYYPKRPPQRVLDWALDAKEKGLIKHIGLTTHNREMVVPLMQEKIIDYFHVRYNAVHRGAEQDIFPFIQKADAGLVSFTATCWGKLLKPKKLPAELQAPSAGDCYRFVLTRDEINCCMMGVKNKEMLRENLQGLAKGPMSEKELENMIAIGKTIYGSA